jgi:hypothetical protein
MSHDFGLSRILYGTYPALVLFSFLATWSAVSQNVVASDSSPVALTQENSSCGPGSSADVCPEGVPAFVMDGRGCKLDRAPTFGQCGEKLLK